MWHLVQHDPNETVSLGSYEDYERAKFIMINKQRFNSHCKYEIIHSSQWLDLSLIGANHRLKETATS